MLLFLLAPAAFAHPLDDRAQMASEVVLVSDSRLEYVLDFRYANVMASWSEFSGGGGMNSGLDADGDGMVTRVELKRRYNVLVDEMAFSLGISVDGAPIDLEPDFERFVFENMDRPDSLLDLDSGVQTSTFRIHYRFVFWWESPQPLTPGAHKVEYYFTGMQSVVHTPEQQMIAFDARTEPRVRIEEVSYDKAMQAYPKLVFDWVVAARQPEPPVVTANPAGVTTAPRPEGDAIPVGGEPEGDLDLLPAWLTLIAGGVLALAGVLSGLRVLVKGAPEGKTRLRALAGAGLLVLAGGVILLGVMVRMGVIDVLR